MTQKDYYDFREDGETRQVSLDKLIRCALRKWKLIILAGIIVGALFGAYKIMSVHSKKDAMIKSYNDYKENLDMYNTNISDYNRSIRELQASISERLEYMQNSPAMQIDPYNCPISTAQIRIVPAAGNELSSQEVYSLLYSIYDEIYYGDTSKIVAEKHNMNTSDLNELLYLRIPSSGTTMTVVIRGQDEAQAESIRDDLFETVLNRKNVFSNFGDFDIEVFGKGTLTVVEPYLQTTQLGNSDSLTKLQTSLRTAQNQLSQLVKPTSVPQYSKKYMLKNGIKLGVVGFAGGICLAVIALICLILYRGAILSADEIDGEYGLRTLADLSSKKPGDESVLEYMIARIENCTEGKDCAKIGIVGTIPADRIDALAGKLNELAEKASESFRFVSVPNLEKDAGSYRKLKDLGAVILAEEVGKSDYNAIRREIALIADSSELLGTIYY